MSQFGADQTAEERIEFIAPRQPLASDLVETGAHAVKLQAGHGVDDLMSLQKLAKATVACWRGKVLAQTAAEVVELASPFGAAMGAHRRQGLGH
jgi:hypothetical protein